MGLRFGTLAVQENGAVRLQMRIYGQLTIILFALLVPARAGPSNIDIPALVRRAKPAVVQILTFDQTGAPLYTGTGFFISADGYLLTNYHLLDGAASILARSPSGTIFHLKKIAALSRASDVAELQFDATTPNYLGFGSTTDAVEGQRVLVIGNPEGLEGTVSDGIISAFRENRSLIQISAPISHGSSGSPVLNEFGQVIGIATSIWKDGQNLNFAISAETVRDAIAKSLKESSGWDQFPLVLPGAANPPQAKPTWTPPATDMVVKPSSRAPTVTPSARSKKNDRPTPSPSPVSPQSSSETIRMEIPGEGITLVLPADWVAIPQTVVEEYKNALARLSSDSAQARKTMAGWGFVAQHKGENYFEYPYLMVSVQNTGRISAAHFHETLGPMETTQIEKLFPDLKLGKGATLTYDPGTNRFLCEFGMKAGEVSCRNLWTMIPTENGWVNIFMYSTEKDFNFWNPVFHKIGTDVELSPSLAYRPRWTDNATITAIIEGVQHIDWSKALAMGIAFAIIGFIRNLFRRKAK